MVVKVISSYKEFKEVIANKQPSIIDFWATWCGPCRTISPVLDKLSEKPEFKDLVSFYKVDVDELEEVAFELNIQAMPTFAIFSEGAKLEQILGANTPALTQLVQKAAEVSQALQSKNEL